MSQFLPWFESPPDNIHAGAKRFIIKLALRSPEVANKLASWPWLVDGVTENEHKTIGFLYSMAHADEHLAALVSEYAWVADGLQESENWPANLLLDMARNNQETAALLVGLPWLADEVNDLETSILYYCASLAYEGQDLAKGLAAQSWLTDGVSQHESGVAAEIVEIAKVDPELARVMLEFPWLRREANYGNRETFPGLAKFIAWDPVLGRRLATVPWLLDGVSQQESEVVAEIVAIAKVDSQLAKTVLEFPWLRYDANYDDVQTILGLAKVVVRDPVLGRRLAAAPEIADEEFVTSQVWWDLDRLAVVAPRDPELVSRILDTSPGPLSWRNRHLFGALSFLMQERPDAYMELTRQSWFADGLNDEEAAFLITAPDVLNNAPDEYFQMLNSRYAESRIVNLPLAGEVSIWAIQKEPFPQGEDITATIAEGLVALEEFLGIPFPRDFVVALIPVVGPDTEIEVHYSSLTGDWEGGGAYAGGYFRATRPEGNSVPLSVIYHELAHYYFAFAHPAWLLEGGASFMATYVKDRVGVESLESRRANLRKRVDGNCRSDEVRNIHDLGEPGFFLQADSRSRCFYSMGEEFLAELSLSLGLHTTSGALRELLQAIHSLDRSVPLQTKDIVLAWWNNTPPERWEDFRRLFRQMHGGPVAEFNPAVSGADDYGDSESDAASLTLSRWVQGDLGSVFDTDVFRFRAEEGKTYLINFYHQNIDLKTASEDFYLTMTTVDGGPSWLRAHGGGEYGVETAWIARRTGDYYVSVASAVGTVGPYSLLVSPEGSVADDHGDDTESATPLAIGSRAEGYLGHETDVDSFYIDALSGYSYEVAVGHSSVQYSRVTLFGPPGSAWEKGKPAEGWGKQGSRNRWLASETGHYYLAVENPFGTPGSYFINVTETAPQTGDHGDTASSASPIRLGQTVQGQLEHSLDQDYFVFRAEADREYSVIFDHDTITYQPVIILAPDGKTLVHEHPPFDRQYRDTYTPWVAPESAYYYVVFRSPDGDTGTYTLTVLAGVAGNDDHGGTPRTATRIGLDQVIPGSLDQEMDFDHFRFFADQGQEYEIRANYRLAQMPDVRLWLFAPDGMTQADRFVDRGRIQRGKYLEWVAPASGEYIVVLWSPEGDVGDYTLEVLLGFDR